MVLPAGAVCRSCCFLLLLLSLSIGPAVAHNVTEVVAERLFGKPSHQLGQSAASRCRLVVKPCSKTWRSHVPDGGGLRLGSAYALPSEIVLPGEGTITIPDNATMIVGRAGILLPEDVILGHGGTNIIPTDMELGGHLTFPNVNVTMPRALRHHDGTTRPAGFVQIGGGTIEAGSAWLGGIRLSSGTLIPAATVIPAGTVLPAGTTLPGGTTLPRGTVLPAGVNLPGGTAYPRSISLPRGV
ncbi:hypothetical protein QBC33DRAFT_592676 [Phialemonium atrogriseum]|uniref:Uncharacterized protein n=1 Tax=Phialemonium atrogriseum TaxID=1093897 RepID=A0AAJ0C851_9PEZI|nr:uncharacterized protein QBC33DRAFT_592676 [Phialemonium atrogriseum]KAK1771920.1 hypothetical protein QBC33DRAFT_592676 [Phialemonium atrogriseum]